VIVIDLTSGIAEADWIIEDLLLALIDQITPPAAITARQEPAPH
jgi:hypothetical protein